MITSDQRANGQTSQAKTQKNPILRRVPVAVASARSFCPIRCVYRRPGEKLLPSPERRVYCELYTFCTLTRGPEEGKGVVWPGAEARESNGVKVDDDEADSLAGAKKRRSNDPVDSYKRWEEDQAPEKWGIFVRKIICQMQKLASINPPLFFV